MGKKKVLVGGISLIIGFSCLSLVSKPTYQEMKINDLNKESLAVYIKNEVGSYEKSSDIPTSGYILNEEKSTCNNNAKVSWNKANNSLKIKDLSSNTSCYLYFDKQERLTVQDIIDANNPKTETPDFSQIAETDEGVYAVEDPMYSGTSYYWRGAATTNYMKFAGFCWRIVRINGDKSVRLIYDGTTCHDNGESTTDSIAVASVAYNSNYNNSSYVGWTYTVSSQRPIDNTTGIESNAKTQLENWYDSNLAANDSFIANGKFCNDRNTQNNETWNTSSDLEVPQYYAGYQRLWINYVPTLSCPSGDVYTLKVGAITADEVEFAGGKNENNISYYLYNGQNYWTMSPLSWNVGLAFVSRVYNNGVLGSNSVSNIENLRPVINLRSDIQIKAGTDGTLNNPYVVED